MWISEWTDGFWEDPTGGNVADSAESQTLKNYEIAKNSGSFTQTITSSVENGTLYYSQVLELTLPVLSAATSVEIDELLKARLAVVVEDNNGNYFVMGLKHGVEGSGGAIQTGAAKGDLNGYQLNLISEESVPAPTVTKAANGTDLTWTLATA